MTNLLSDKEAALIDAYWRAANYLSVGQIYLFDNPLLKIPLERRARQAAPARPLGHDAGPQLHLRPPQPADQEIRPRHDLHHRPGPRRPGAGGQRLPRGDLQRGLSQRVAGRGGDEATLHPVLVPGRHPEPRRARDARLDPRGRRARLRDVARPRSGVRQPEPHRRLRRRRRRGRDRPDGDELALEQVPQSGPRRRGAADPAPERLQDRQPDGARAHPARRARRPVPRLRLRSAFRRGRRPEDDAPADGRDAREGRGRDPRHPDGRAGEWVQGPPQVADDRHAHAEGLDLPQVHRRQARGRVLARPPGADGRHGQARARGHPRRLDEELSARGAVRRGRRAQTRSRGAGALWNTPHERQSAHQRRRAPARAQAAGLSRLRRRRSVARRRDRRGDAGHGNVPPRRDEAQPGVPQLPPVQPGREQFQPLAGRAGGDQARLGRRDGRLRRSFGARRPGDGDAVASTSAKAGSRATCSPGGTASSRATRRSSTSSIRCSTSTPSGSR